MTSGKQINKDYKALVLAEAEMVGKSEAARRHNISPRTLYNWHEKLQQDPELAEKFRNKQNYLQFRWVERLPNLMEQAIACIERCLQEAPSDPKTLDSAIRALELGSQMQISLKAKETELESVGVKINRQGD